MTVFGGTPEVTVFWGPGGVGAVWGQKPVFLMFFAIFHKNTVFSEIPALAACFSINQSKTSLFWGPNRGKSWVPPLETGLGPVWDRFGTQTSVWGGFEG